PVVEKDSTGKVGKIVGAPQRVQGILKSLQRKDRISEYLRKAESKSIDLQSFRLQLPLDNNVRRLVVKMCVGVITHLDVKADPLDSNSRSFLLSEGGFSIPVMISVQDFAELEQARSPLNHLIYVEFMSKAM
ncbi:MAG: hypothetical protein ACRD5H_16165, partial [Nitrososphaerales archaeon]